MSPPIRGFWSARCGEWEQRRSGQCRSRRILLKTGAGAHRGVQGAAAGKFREPYRPFAPSVLAECADRYFELPTAEQGVPVVDVAADLPGGDTYFADFVHFNDLGARMVAEMAAQRAPCFDRAERFGSNIGRRHCGP